MSDTPKDPDNEENNPDETKASQADVEDQSESEDAQPLVTDGEDETSHADVVEEAEASEDEKAADDGKAADELQEALAGAALISSGAAVVPETIDHSHEHDDEGDEASADEASGSLAGKVLTWLVLLIAGAGLALWGGPKIAPSLPSGLGPVKAWLLPGQSQVEDEIAALRQSTDARFAALPVADNEEVLAEVEALIATRTSSFESEMSALADKVAGSDGAEIEARLAQLETRISGMASQLEALGDLSGNEGISESSLAEISQFSASIDGLRAEISELAANDGRIGQRLEEVAAAAARRVEAAEASVSEAETSAAEAERLATLRASFASIEASLTAGTPYRDALERAKGSTDVEIPDVLDENADSGVKTVAALSTSFPDAAHAAIRADISARAGDGPLGRFGAFLESQVASRSLTPQEGDTTDAVLSRIEAALSDGNLDAAVAEAASLPSDAANAMAGWIKNADGRARASTALEELSQAALGIN